MTYRIAVGVDGSQNSQAALSWAVDHARRLGGEVMAIFAWEMPFLSIPGAFDRDQLSQAAHDLLDEAVNAVVLHPPVALTQMVAEGDPTESLVMLSKEVDLLVVGTRGRGRFAGLMLGSVSQGCASSATCPVVVVKRALSTDGEAPRPTVAG